MNRTELVVALVLTAFGAIVVAESLRMPRFENIGGSLATAPGLVPGMLGAVLALFGVVMAIRAVVAGGPPETPGRPILLEDEVDGPTEPPEPPSAGRARMAWMLVLSLFYAGFLVGRIDFAVATFLFVFASIVVFELPAFRSARIVAIRTAIAAVIALAIAWSVPYVFENIFLVNLP